jgi:hypothetical protein
MCLIVVLICVFLQVFSIYLFLYLLALSYLLWSLLIFFKNKFLIVLILFVKLLIVNIFPFLAWSILCWFFRLHFCCGLKVSPKGACVSQVWRHTSVIPALGEAEAGELRVQDQPGLHGEIFWKKKQKKTNRHIHTHKQKHPCASRIWLVACGAEEVEEPSGDGAQWKKVRFLGVCPWHG